MDNFMTPRELVRNGLSSSYMTVGKLLTTLKNDMAVDEDVKTNTFYKRLFNTKRGITANLWIDVMDALGYDIVAVKRGTGIVERIYSEGDTDI